jgi:HK97 gp10 family phage protein
MAKGGFNHLSQISNAMRAELKRALDDGINMIASEVKLSMAEPKSGRVYQVSRTGKEHVASAPGEAPAIDTGALVNSIDTSEDGEFTRVVHTNQEYADVLEFGRRDGKMAARPFMRPAAEKKKDAVMAKLAEALRRASNGS